MPWEAQILPNQTKIIKIAQFPGRLDFIIAISAGPGPGQGRAGPGPGPGPGRARDRARAGPGQGRAGAGPDSTFWTPNTPQGRTIEPQKLSLEPQGRPV